MRYGVKRLALSFNYAQRLHDTSPLIHPLVLTRSTLSSMRSTLVGVNGKHAGDVREPSGSIVVPGRRLDRWVETWPAPELVRAVTLKPTFSPSKPAVFLRGSSRVQHDRSSGARKSELCLEEMRQMWYMREPMMGMV